MPTNEKRVVLISEPQVQLAHVNGPQHPERPQRLTAVLDALRDLPLIERGPAPALDAVRRVHPQAHIDAVRQLSETGGGAIDADTSVCTASYAAALSAAGCAVGAIDAVLEQDVHAFAAVRPPGHHAEASRAMGFCLFNNIAAAARHAQARGVGKIAIVDFDVHHGNGTQAIFYEDPSVLFVSLHQEPATLWPGDTGFAEETGRGAGLGFNLNIPLPAGTDDAAYLHALHDKALPAVTAFGAEMLLISAGFDAHAADPLAQLQLSTDAFGEITRALLELNLPTASFLEGGYNLEALGSSVHAHVKPMCE